MIRIVKARNNVRVCRREKRGGTFLNNNNNNSDNNREHSRRFFRGRKVKPGEEHNNGRRIIRAPDANKPWGRTRR